jgi:peptidoglycan/xylan/chitin deacetylase (PgdA/CDA1 family)
MDEGEIRARLDLPPPDTARATIAADFGRRFMLFGDAEEEFDWNGPFARDHVSTTAIAALPAANRRFLERGLIPTYLVDYPVVDDPRSAATIAEMVAADACDVGTQLHPWVNPPFEEEVNPRNSYVGNLPRALQRAKLHALTDRIEQAVGRRPIIYRAGRYGIGPHTADLLAEAGYRMDVSIRALFDYSAQGGPDFSGHPVWAWWIGPGLLEVPLTSAFVGGARRWPGLHRRPAWRGPLAASGLLNRVSLTPEGTPLAEALAAIRQLLRDGTRLFSLSFHTPSVEIGHTPYVRDAADLRRFWAWWDGVFDLFAREGVEPARPADILAAAR